MCVTICGRFRPDEGAVAGYGNRIRVKYTAKWGVQIAGMIFQTYSSMRCTNAAYTVNSIVFRHRCIMSSNFFSHIAAINCATTLL